MNTLTENEKKMLVNIVENEYTFLNGAKPTNFDDACGTYADSLECGPHGTFIDPAGFGGVIASLVKKNLVTASGRGREASIAVTRAGFDAWQAL